MQRTILAASAILSCILPCGCGQPEARETEVGGVVGRELEPFDLPSLDGGMVSWAAGSADEPAAATFVHVFQPDCLACREQARALERVCAKQEAARVIGVAYRGTAEDVAAFRAATGASYPLAVGAGSSWADRWGIGDPMYVVGREGRVRYAQVGFHPDDAERWLGAVRALAAGRVPRVTGPGRAAIAAGQRMPAIDLPDLDGRALRLSTEDGRLGLVAGDAAPRSFRAAVGFFSRY